MVQSVVNLIQVFRQRGMEFRQRPCRERFRVDGFGDLADIACDLRVPFQIVDELRVHDAKQAFACGAEPRLRRWSGFLGAFISCEQCLEISTLKFTPSIHNENLRESPKPAHTFPQDHHAGPVAWRIECEVKRQDSARVCVAEQ